MKMSDLRWWGRVLRDCIREFFKIITGQRQRKQKTQ